MHSADVAIVGGGVIGWSVAFHLVEGGFDGRVLVIEPDPSFESGSTGRSAGGLRQQFSLPENIRMSRYGLDFVRQAPARLAVDGEAPDLAFKEQGYLFLAPESGMAALTENQAVQTAEGADVALLDRDGLAEIFPWLALDDLAGGAFGRSGEGWLDPYALMQALKRKARSLGAELLQDRVTGIEIAGGRVEALTTEAGRRVACGRLVNAAGAAAGRVAALAGLDLPVAPKKRQVFVFDCREDLAHLPLTVDPSGVYFRPEGAQFICGKSPDPQDDPDCWDDLVDYTLFEEVLWPTLAARVPAFEAIKMQSAWAGWYEVNTLDHNAVIGPHPQVETFLFANGFSGHGLQQAPAVGRAIAELIETGGFRSLDLSRLGYARIAAGAPLFERGIV
ncbi:MAG: FAD-binding oxidoreductase [Marivibrio sp.]|uniref:NAD(P)/FAD-dependent oxidoreductase n=1 Tax=Marivibrio sp. TaxID=2039719 RepID=UPI0032EF2259